MSESRISFAGWQRLVKSSHNSPYHQSILEGYRGARVTWQGVVGEVSAAGGFDGEPLTLVLYEDLETLRSTSLGRAPALCSFSADHAAVLSSLRTGQQVVVQGTLAAPPQLHGTLLGTRLYECRLLR